MKPKAFLNEDFLLENDFAAELYHDHAARMPVIDYHNHLPPRQVAEDHRFGNITQAWLYGDHYKWRAMRTLGVEERYITGDAPDREKFLQWSESVPYTIRNPLYHWTHLELLRYFGIRELLTGSTAGTIYDTTTEMLQSPAYSTNGLLKKQNVELICTTDDPVDDLRYHQTQRSNPDGVRMLPAFRPDKLLSPGSGHFRNYLESFGRAADRSIRKFSDLLDALESRIRYFHEQGCRLADHGLEKIDFCLWKKTQLEAIFQKALHGQLISPEEERRFVSAMLYHLGILYHRYGWVQQFHLGAQRNNNARMMKQLGPDTGFDSIGDFPQAAGLARFLDRLDRENKLARTILYNLNPADNEVMATMIGNYNDGSFRGKIQWGSAWWFLDQRDGMEKQLNTLSNMGLLSCFVGMLTDSRSFLSFPRHEYFRRILCNLIGRDVQNGELPADMPWLGKIVQDISYYNARHYFDFFNES
jgi:glucuronate isomerase